MTDNENSKYIGRVTDTGREWPQFDLAGLPYHKPADTVALNDSEFVVLSRSDVTNEEMLKQLKGQDSVSEVSSEPLIEQSAQDFSAFSVQPSGDVSYDVSEPASFEGDGGFSERQSRSKR